jgi:hypothetical protein
MRPLSIGEVWTSVIAFDAWSTQHPVDRLFDPMVIPDPLDKAM